MGEKILGDLMEALLKYQQASMSVDAPEMDAIDIAVIPLAQKVKETIASIQEEKSKQMQFFAKL